MRPELGKKYKLRDGRITEPVTPNWKGSPYPFVAEVPGSGRRSWDTSGRFSSFAWSNCPCDIVEVVQ